ncbi:MAG: hypothetical protein QOH28_3503 [Actinomycetota bacterium]|nr:hypothetical protein [Actinomycetota bacterium]
MRVKRFGRWWRASPGSWRCRFSVACTLVVFVALTTVDASSALADSTVNGCTIVARPTPTHFTNCPGADLSGANLSGVDLSFSNLLGANLVGADLTFAVLRRANLSNASLATCVPQPDFSVRCNAADLSHANLTLASLAGAALFGANLTFAEMRGANLSYSSLASCFFTVNGPTCARARFDSADLTYARLTGAVMSSCDSIDFGDFIGIVSYCGGVVMEDATLVGADLSNTNLSFADLAHTNLIHAALRTATFGECAPFSRLIFEVCGGADLTDSDLAHANLSGLHLNGVNFAGADLFGADLAGADLSALGLPDFPIAPTNLSMADLRNADLRNANLAYATLAGAQLGHANLTAIMWFQTTCPDGTNSDNDGNTCVNNF